MVISSVSLKQKKKLLYKKQITIFLQLPKKKKII